ncbi:hypothetical protein PAMP_020547 [Pampus punctatissimus]
MGDVHRWRPGSRDQVVGSFYVARCSRFDGRLTKRRHGGRPLYAVIGLDLSLHITEEGFHCLQPGSGACLCKIEAFFQLGECKGMREKGVREREDKIGWGGGKGRWVGGGASKRDPRRCA